MDLKPNALPLREIHLPDPISFWPLAIGWWLLFALFMGTLLLIYFLYKSYSKSSLKKEAAKELEALERACHEKENAIESLAALSAFLRRVTLSQKNQSTVAGLTGEAWLEMLDQPLNQPTFRQGVGRLLLTAPYQQSVKKEELLELFQLCKKWVEAL